MPNRNMVERSNQCSNVWWMLLNVRKMTKNICGISKWSAKPINLDNFEQQALSRLILWFYKKTTTKRSRIDKILPKCKSFTEFPNISNNTLREWCIQLGFCYKHWNKKTGNVPDIWVIEGNKYLKNVLDLISQGWNIFCNGAEILNKVGNNHWDMFLKIAAPYELEKSFRTTCKKVYF